MPYHDLKLKLAKELEIYFKHPELKYTDLLNDFTTPPKLELGHVALPCFRISKLLGVAAGLLSKQISENFKPSNIEVIPTGPYANFKWNAEDLFIDTLNAVQSQGARYGSSPKNTDKKVILEYCSPNIAKKLGFQHIRTTLIGNTLANIYEYLGYDTTRINFVGDWGTQFAKLIAAFELWGDKSKLDKSKLNEGMNHLLDIYVRFHKEADTEPELLKRAQLCLQKLENQDPTTTELWKLVKEISITAMDKTLARMNVKFDHIEGESTYIPRINETLEKVKKEADAKLSDGAWIVELQDVSTPALIQKRDGTTLYLTRDIAAAIERNNRFKFNKSLYVVSEQQRLHFQQLFGTLKKMGMTWAENCIHVSFGTVHFGSEKMSTREGRVIFLDTLLDEATSLALEECTKKNPDLKNKEEVAERVGIGAVIFGELSSHRTRDIHFDWKSILALDGETGPYVQYAVVRCESLLDKAGEGYDLQAPLSFASPYTFAPEEENLVLCLSKYRTQLIQCVNEDEPFYLTSYLIDLAKVFSRFYYQLPVLQTTDPIQKSTRVTLVKATRIALKSGLELLGIQCPKEM